MGLIPFDEASRRLRVSGQSYLGVREIPVDRIVGSVDRSGDFDRDFRPRRGLSRSRLASLRAASRDGELPPIEVFGVGGAYFVEDGHHRVALARERRADFIDAEVTRLQTNHEVGPGVDVCQLVHNWYDTVYSPGVEAVRRASLPELYASWHSTDADLFLWVYQLRRDLRAHDPAIDFDAAARHARTLNLGRRRKRDHLGGGRRPLPQRGG